MANKDQKQSKTKKEKIYLNIDHLEKGEYELDILLDNKVVKSVKIERSS